MDRPDGLYLERQSVGVRHDMTFDRNRHGGAAKVGRREHEAHLIVDGVGLKELIHLREPKEPKGSVVQWQDR